MSWLTLVTSRPYLRHEERMISSQTFASVKLNCPGKAWYSQEAHINGRCGAALTFTYLTDHLRSSNVPAYAVDCEIQYLQTFVYSQEVRCTYSGM